MHDGFTAGALANAISKVKLSSVMLIYFKKILLFLPLLK